MKKLLFILLCVPLIGLGQTAKDYFDSGNKQIRKQEFQLAIDDFTRGIEIDYDSTWLQANYYSRAIAYESLNQYEKSLDDWNKYIDMAPDQYIGYNFRSGIYKNLERYSDALYDCNKAIKLFMRDKNGEDYNYILMDLYRLRGEINELLGKNEDALEDYTKLVLGADDFITLFENAYVIRAELYIKLERYKLAMQDFTKAINLDSLDQGALCGYKMATSYSKRAELKRELGLDYCSDYKRASELDESFKYQLPVECDELMKNIEDLDSLLEIWDNLDNFEIPEFSIKGSWSSSDLEQCELDTKNKINNNSSLTLMIDRFEIIADEAVSCYCSGIQNIYTSYTSSFLNKNREEKIEILLDCLGISLLEEYYKSGELKYNRMYLFEQLIMETKYSKSGQIKSNKCWDLEGNKIECPE
jgi:tetratricopeptide (TPR) repeat protein